MKESEQEGLIVVVSGPSGSGKTTLCREVVRKRCDAEFSVSVTTRQPRNDEKDGVDYHFVTPAEFRRRRDAGELAEWAEVFGRMYGTPAAPLENALKEGRNILLDIDVQGALQVKRRYPQAILIFVLPPSPEELVRRIRKRKSESCQEVERRLARMQEELKCAEQYDFLVLNNSVDETAEEIESIIIAEKSRQKRRQRMVSSFLLSASLISKGRSRNSNEQQHIV